MAANLRLSRLARGFARLHIIDGPASSAASAPVFLARQPLVRSFYSSRVLNMDSPAPAESASTPAEPVATETPEDVGAQSAGANQTVHAADAADVAGAYDALTSSAPAAASPAPPAQPNASEPSAAQQDIDAAADDDNILFSIPRDRYRSSLPKRFQFAAPEIANLETISLPHEDGEFAKISRADFRVPQGDESDIVADVLSTPTLKTSFKYDTPLPSSLEPHERRGRFVKAKFGQDKFRKARAAEAQQAQTENSYEEDPDAQDPASSSPLHYTPRDRRPVWLVQKEALRAKFPEGWRPQKRLSPDAMAGIRALHAQFPEEYTTRTLSEKFAVSPEAIRRILRSKWAPSAEEEASRQARWFKRGMAVWERYAELGLKPPKKWRAEGVGKEAWERRKAVEARKEELLEEVIPAFKRGVQSRPRTKFM